MLSRDPCCGPRRDPSGPLPPLMFGRLMPTPDTPPLETGTIVGARCRRCLSGAARWQSYGQYSLSRLPSSTTFLHRTQTVLGQKLEQHAGPEKHPEVIVSCILSHHTAPAHAALHASTPLLEEHEDILLGIPCMGLGFGFIWPCMLSGTIGLVPRPPWFCMVGIMPLLIGIMLPPAADCSGGRVSESMQELLQCFQTYSGREAQKPVKGSTVFPPQL